MRTDVKIGAAVGLAVVVLLVLYFVFSGSGTPSPQPAPMPVAEVQDVTGPVAEIVQPRIAALPKIEPAVPGMRSTTQPADVFRLPPGLSDEESVSVDVRLTPPAPGEARPAVPAIAQPSIGTPVAPAIPAPAAPPPAIAAAPPAPKMYMVQEGDMGFWPIAAKVYGDGKYMYLIAKANAGVNSTALKAGQKLVIPPLPASTRLVAAPIAPPGVGIASVGIRRTYTVKQGQGYWAIAQEVYGNGKYWTIIQTANPDKQTLKPGMVLVIPDLPSPTRAGTPAAPAGSTAAVSTPPAASAGASAAPSTSAQPLRPVFD